MNAAAPTVLILTTLARLEAEIAASKRPPAWRTWEVDDDKEAREHGPFWSDVTALADADAERVRLGRARDALEKAGLVACHRHEYSGRVKRVRLTAEGKKAAAEAAREHAPAATTE